MKVMAELDIAEKRVPQDGRFKVRVPGKTIDFRVSVMPTVHGEDSVIRILDKTTISEQFRELRLDILGFAAAELRRFRQAIQEPYGMVLVTGPTGSGKTTTLYAALSEIHSPEDKIITIEDPVEYQLHGVTQIPINERKGLTFARGLRSILRHDPDKIMVGEIRDSETAQIAIQSALTGHLVFTTVHANNVLDVLGRFLNMGVEAYQFVSSLNCVMAQRLVRLVCVHCRRPVIRSPPRRFASPGSTRRWPRPTSSSKGLGCIECGGTGYRGRTALCELLDLTDDLREMISGPGSHLGDQASDAGQRDAFSPRFGGRESDIRTDDAAGNQQGDLCEVRVRTEPDHGCLDRPPSAVVHCGRAHHRHRDRGRPRHRPHHGTRTERRGDGRRDRAVAGWSADTDSQRCEHC